MREAEMALNMFTPLFSDSVQLRVTPWFISSGLCAQSEKRIVCRAKGTWMRMIWLVLCLVPMAACAVATKNPEPGRFGTLRVATEAGFPPFNSRNEQGELVGLDIDLFRAAANKAGYEVEFLVEPEFSELFRMVDDGRADAIASTVSITADRKRRYLFTRPYFETGISVIVREDDDRIKVPRDIASRTVGAPAGTTSATIAQELAADEVRDFATSNAAINALLAGEIDAYLIDEVEARELVVGRAVRMLAEPAAVEGYGFLFAKSRREAKSRVDAAMTNFLPLHVEQSP